MVGARVTLCDIDRRRLEAARRIGAAEAVVDVGGDGWERNIRDGEFRVVLDVAGVPGMEGKLIAAAQLRGTVLFVAGRFEVAYPFNLGQRREITLKQNSTSSDRISTTCVAWCSGEWYDWRP